MKILTVIGARPQFIKAAPVSAALSGVAEEIVVHTGQHYDFEMSEVFFRELELKEPDYNLEVGSGPHGAQTAEMLHRVEQVMISEKPDMVMVYGDTNSTLAGALAAAKLNIPVAHVEAGLRSFNRAMPEEINRVVTDHLSQLLFVPSATSQQWLLEEGITHGVHITGDVMYDAILHYAPKAARVSRYPGSVGLARGQFFMCTLHRGENVDDGEKLSQIVQALDTLPMPVVFPVHPRTRKRLAEFEITPGSNIRVTKPISYMDTLQLVQSARAVLTDSGGLQKEAYYLGVPCITLRSETEWTETVDAGWNRLVGHDPRRIREGVEAAARLPKQRPELYGDGRAAMRIAEVLTSGVRNGERSLAVAGP